MKKDFLKNSAVLIAHVLIFLTLAAVLVFGTYGAVRYLFFGGF